MIKTHIKEPWLEITNVGKPVVKNKAIQPEELQADNSEKMAYAINIKHNKRPTKELYKIADTLKK